MTGIGRPPKHWNEYPAPVRDGGCLRWQGPKHSQGYGLCGEVGNGSQYAHRVAYERAFGAIPDGLVVDHVRDRGCRYRDCVEPAHLEAVTQVENARRGGFEGGDWGQADKTECPSGHPYDAANTYVWTDQKTGRQERGCRACRLAAKHRYRARLRAEGKKIR